MNRLYEQREDVLNEVLFEKCLADIVRSEGLIQHQTHIGMQPFEYPFCQLTDIH